MESINAVINDIASLVGDLLGNVLLYGISGAVLGLVIGIYLVKRFGQQGLFNRSNPFWTFIAKCNYVLLPLALLITGLTQGGIYGAHHTAEVWIEQTTTPIVDYAENYLPQLQTFCNKHLVSGNAQQATIEDIVVAQNPRQAEGISGSMLTSFNVFLVGGFLDLATPTSGAVAEPLVLMSQVDLQRLDRKVFEVLPASMRAVCSFYFAGVYWVFFFPFLCYFLVVAGEIFLYRLVSSQQSEFIEEGYYPEQKVFGF